MDKFNLKVGIIFTLMLFLMIGVASASENITETIAADNVDAEALNQEIGNVMSVENNQEDDNLQVYDDIQITDEPRDHPQIQVSTQKGYQGKTLTLKATVKKEDGSISPATVQFKFNGKTYTAKTNANGVASVTLKFPKSSVLKTTSKTKGKILTKTTYYQKTYGCDVTVDGDEYYTGYASFDVISKKKPVVKKYKIIKKKKIRTIKVKNGVKGYKKGNYGILTYKYHKGYFTHVETAMIHKSGKFVKFFIKHHYKKNGKWKWNKWSKVPLEHTNDFYYGSAIKLDKIKVKYTQVSYKRI